MFQKLNSKLVSSLSNIVIDSLTSKQFNLLKQISSSKNTASSFVEETSHPNSTTWHNLHQLKRRNLIDFGNKSKIKLTSLGKIILIFSRDSSMVGRSAVARQVAGSTPAHGITKYGRLKNVRR